MNWKFNNIKWKYPLEKLPKNCICDWEEISKILQKYL